MTAMLIFIASAAICGVLMRPIQAVLLRAGIVDNPNPRSSHSKPTIRGGGIAIVLAALGGLIIVGRAVPSLVLGVACPLLALSAISLWDDLRGAGVRVRLTVQASAALLALTWLFFSDSPGTVTIDIRLVVECCLGAIWVIGYTNAFNFMDGINGLAGFQTVISGLGMVVVGFFAGLPLTHPALVETIIVAGAGAGFLPYNFPRARVFMGDVGSASVGFILAFLALWIAREAGWWLLLPLACLHANFFLDVVITMARRLARGDVLYHAHREHFYQRLVRAGYSHSFVTGAETLLQLIVLVLVTFGVKTGPANRFVVAGVVGVIWGSLFCFTEFEFRRHHSTRIAP